MQMIDHRANFESDVWNGFNALGLGYCFFLIATSTGQMVICIPPSTRYALFYLAERDMEPLVENSLVEKVTYDLPENTEAKYEMTEKGRKLFQDIENQFNHQRAQGFISSIDLKYPPGM